jgi:hypothetical protein
MMKTTRRLAVATALAAGVLAWVPACTTPEADGAPVDGALAAVSIQGADIIQVRDAVYSVMATAGFSRDVDAGGLVFDKRGSALRQVGYASYMGGAAYDRIKLDVDSISPTSHVIRADVYIVRNKGSLVGDDERPVLGIRAGQYQELLDEIKARAEAGL